MAVSNTSQVDQTAGATPNPEADGSLTREDQSNPLGRFPLPNREFWRGLFQSYRRLLVYVRPHWVRLATGALLLVINSLLGLTVPLVVQRIVDGVLAGTSMVMLTAVTLGLILLFVVRGLLESGEIYLIAWVAERVVADLRIQLYAHLQSMPLRFFNSTRTG